ncbi:MAG TPA: UDP-N-acetylmuramoyl-L-alanine--D-glutamate ligase [Gammaproteobacteria bacterium]
MMAAVDYNAAAGVKGATVIVGLGKTGLSVARYLAQRGEAFVVADSRRDPPGLKQLLSIAPNVECHLGGFEPRIFEQAQRLIVSPGVSIKEPVIASAVARGAEILGDIALFAAQAGAPIVAITGSNGKSTVTAMAGAMAEHAGLNAKVGGNIGIPALDFLTGPAKAVAGDAPMAANVEKPAFYVLELSSFQLETTPNLNAFAAVVLNVSADHMDRYTTIQEYSAAKQIVYRNCHYRVFNRDDALGTQLVKQVDGSAQDQVVSFGLGAPPTGNDFGIDNHGGAPWLMKGQQALMRADEMSLPGRHNQANALAALALGEAMKIRIEDMLHVLRNFVGLPHRMQLVAELKEVSWYNDSKGTNVGATVSAIAGMPGSKLLIAGGDGKGADFEPLRAAVIANNVRLVILIGRDADRIEKVLSGVVQIETATTMQAAVVLASKLAKAGEKVILSPACASFDMFNDYQHRGDVFMQAVRSLPL